MPAINLEFAERCFADPVFFFEHVLGIAAWDIQQEIARSVVDNSETLVSACHASGKTYTAAAVALWWMSTRVPSVMFSTAPTFRQVEKVLWTEMRGLKNRAKLPLPGKIMKVPEWHIGDNHFAFGFSTDNPDAAQGIHNRFVLGIYDEAVGVKQAVWEAQKGNFAGGFSRLLAQANPTNPTSTFYDHCQLSYTNHIEISAFDTPNFTATGITLDDIKSGAWRGKAHHLPMPDTLITPQYVFEMLEEYGETHPAFVARVLGRFPDSADDALIPFYKIEAAEERWKQHEDSPKRAEIGPGSGPVDLGVDVADGGADQSVITVHDGGYVYEQLVLNNKDVLELVAPITKLVAKHRPRNIRVDKIGVGTGLVARLRELELPVIGVNFGEKPTTPSARKRFLRQRTQHYWALRELFMQDAIAIPPDKKLKQELAQLKIRELSSGHMQLEDKDDLKERIKRSPDRADSLCLAFVEKGAGGVAEHEVDDRDYEEVADEDAERAREVSIMRLFNQLNRGY